MKQEIFSEKSLEKIIKSVPLPSKKDAYKECKICSDIKVVSFDDEYGVSKKPSQIDNFKKIIEIDSRDRFVYACKSCATLYGYKYHYEYFVNGDSEEEYFLYRLKNHQEVEEFITKIALFYMTAPNFIREEKGCHIISW